MEDDYGPLVEKIAHKIASARTVWDKIHQRIQADQQMLGSIGDQPWRAVDATIRGENRAKFVAPLLDKFVEKIVGGYNSNPYGIKYDSIVPGQDDSLAKKLTAAARGIERESDAKSAYRNAIRCAAAFGYGYVHVTTEYDDPDSDSLDVKICIDEIDDPCSIIEDASKECRWRAHLQYIDKSEARELYGEEAADSRLAGADNGFTIRGRELGRDEVSVLTFYELVPSKSESFYDADGGKIESKAKAARSKSRVTYSCWCYKIVGNQVMMMQDLKICFLPIVRCVGTPLWNNGRREYVGIVSKATDSQVLVNYAMSLGGERMALGPKVGYIAAEESIISNPKPWVDSTKSYIPLATYRAYDDDGKQLPAPVKQDNVVSIGDVVTAQGVYADMMAKVIGIPEDGILDAKPMTAEETLTRAKATETVLSTFYEEGAAMVVQCGRVILSMIGAYYSGRRSVPMEIDGALSRQEIDFDEIGASPSAYGVSVDSGPLLATERKDQVRTYLAMASIAPDPFKPLIFPSLVKAVDGADPKLVQSIDSVGQLLLRNSMASQQQDSALSQENEKLRQAVSMLNQQLIASQTELLKSQQKRHDNEINARVDLAMAQLDAQTKLQIEEMKLRGDSEADIRDFLAEIAKERMRQQSEIEKQVAQNRLPVPQMPEIIAPLTNRNAVL